MKDIGENLFWVCILLIGAVTVVSVVFHINNYYDNKNKIVAEAISKSADPIAAACGIKMEDLVDKSICALALSQQMEQ